MTPCQQNLCEREALADEAYKNLHKAIHEGCIENPLSEEETPGHIKRLGDLWGKLAMTPCTYFCDHENTTH